MQGGSGRPAYAFIAQMNAYRTIFFAWLIAAGCVALVSNAASIGKPKRLDYFERIDLRVFLKLKLNLKNVVIDASETASSPAIPGAVTLTDVIGDKGQAREWNRVKDAPNVIVYASKPSEAYAAMERLSRHNIEPLKFYEGGAEEWRQLIQPIMK